MLYQEARPDTLDKFYGNRVAVNSVKKYFEGGKFPNACLFTGPTGCGKTTLARICAKMLGCGEVDLLEMNAANVRGIETAREVSEKSRLLPLSGGARVFLFDESHQLTSAAQEALLKAVEDSPPESYFMFCSTRPNALIKTLRGRCAVFSLEPLSNDVITKMLKDVAEDYNLSLTETAVEAIMLESKGLARTALVFAEQLNGITDEDTIIETVSLPEKEERDAIEIARALAKGRNVSQVQGLYKKLKAVDAERLRRLIMAYFKTVAINNPQPEALGRALSILETFSSRTYVDEPTLVWMIMKVAN